MQGKDGRIPFSIKAPYAVFMAVLVPLYWEGNGPANFLWFCDVSLMTLLLALWLESALLASMTAVGVLVLSICWNLDFFSGARLLGLVDYMFDPAVPLHLRALSLFHVGLPLLALWTVQRLGYDPRAFGAQSALMAVVLLATYLWSDPADNINWAFGPVVPQTYTDPLLYLALAAAGVTLFLCYPTHLVLHYVFDRETSALAAWAQRWRGRQQ